MASTFGDLFGDAPPPEPKTTTYHNKNRAVTVVEGEDRLMPFGKHKSTPVIKLPVDYIVWLWWEREGSDKKLDGWLREEFIRALNSYGIDPEGEKPDTRRSA